MGNRIQIECRFWGRECTSLRRGSAQSSCKICMLERAHRFQQSSRQSAGKLPMNFLRLCGRVTVGRVPSRKPSGGGLLCRPAACGVTLRKSRPTAQATSVSQACRGGTAFQQHLPGVLQASGNTRGRGLAGLNSPAWAPRAASVATSVSCPSPASGSFLPVLTRLRLLGQ